MWRVVLQVGGAGGLANIFHPHVCHVSDNCLRPAAARPFAHQFIAGVAFKPTCEDGVAATVPEAAIAGFCPRQSRRREAVTLPEGAVMVSV